MEAVGQRGVPIPAEIPGIERIRLLLGAGSDAPLRAWIWPNSAEEPDGSIVYLGVVVDGLQPVTIGSPSKGVIFSIEDEVLRDPERTESDFWADVVRAVDEILAFEGPGRARPPGTPQPPPEWLTEE